MDPLAFLLKKQQVQFTYLSGPLLGKLFGQVTTDASSSAGDQNHLLCQVFPTAWQQRRQTCPDYVVQNLNREQKHTTCALKLHLTSIKCSLLQVHNWISSIWSEERVASSCTSLAACKQRNPRLHELLHE